MSGLSRYLLATFASVVLPLPAAILISSGPTNFAGDENLLFNAPGLTLVGNVIEGATNNTGFIIEFSGAGESLTGNGGQARVEGTDGSFTTLTLAPQLPGGSFSTLVFNLDVNVSGSVEFTVTPLVGAAFVQSFDVSGNGQNFFGIETTLDTRIRSVSLVLSNNANTPSGSFIFGNDMSQVRIGGADSGVPEPGTYVLVGAGLVALGWHRRRR